MRTGNGLLSELLARYHNVNFHNRDSADPLLSGRDFLPDPDAETETDAGEDGDADDGGREEAAAPHPIAMPGGAHVGPGLGPRGHGAPIPGAVWALFGEGDEPLPPPRPHEDERDEREEHQ